MNSRVNVFMAGKDSSACAGVGCSLSDKTKAGGTKFSKLLRNRGPMGGTTFCPCNDSTSCSKDGVSLALGSACGCGRERGDDTLVTYRVGRDTRGILTFGGTNTLVDMAIGGVPGSCA